MIKFFTFFLAMSLSILSSAQSYNFSIHNETYNDLTNPISVNNGMTWYYSNFTIPIGFNFHFFDSTMDTFYMIEDANSGWLTNQTNINNPMALLLSFGVEIADRGIDLDTWETSVGSLSPISYQLVGLPGERIFKIEWKNVGFEGDLWDYEEDATDFANFQFWCYESTNVFEVRFGTSNISHPFSSFYEESGPLIGFFPYVNVEEGPLENGVVLQGSATNPTAVWTMEPDFLQGMPPNGIVYRFTPNTAALEESNQDLLIHLTPNPVKNQIKIINPHSNVSIENVLIFNMFGQCVQSEIKDFDSIDVSNLSCGVYSVKVITNQGFKSNKIVKEE